MKRTKQEDLLFYEQPQLTVALFEVERGFAVSEDSQLDDMNENPGSWL